MGKNYDAGWLQNDFPGFARDIDWTVFNAASPDQWWDRDTLPEQASWRIWNMHPQKPVQEGTLPPWHARCFISRLRQEETLFEEITLRATTVWFFRIWSRWCLSGRGISALMKTTRRMFCT
jgi:hypothetical protein